MKRKYILSHIDFINESKNNIRQYPIIREDEHGKKIVWEKDDYYIVIDSDENTRYLSLWYNNKRVGELSLNNRYKRNNKIYSKVEHVEIEKKHRNNGLGKQLYLCALDWIPTDGIISYLPDRVNNKEIPSIYSKMNGYVEDGDYAIIPKN